MSANTAAGKSVFNNITVKQIVIVTAIAGAAGMVLGQWTLSAFCWATAFILKTYEGERQ